MCRTPQIDFENEVLETWVGMGTLRLLESVAFKELTLSYMEGIEQKGHQLKMVMLKESLSKEALSKYGELFDDTGDSGERLALPFEELPTLSEDY
jgi:hypothetical protein